MNVLRLISQLIGIETLRLTEIYALVMDTILFRILIRLVVTERLDMHISI